MERPAPGPFHRVPGTEDRATMWIKRVFYRTGRLDGSPKRTGGRQGAGACCFFFARGVRAHIRGSAPEPQRVSCCAADAWGARLMACATSVGGKSAVGRAAPVRVVYRWCDSLPQAL